MNGRGIWQILTGTGGPATDTDARNAAATALAQAQAAATAAQQAATQAQQANTTAQSAATSSGQTSATLAQLQTAITNADAVHATLQVGINANAAAIAALHPLSYLARADTLTVTIALMASATYTCTLDRTMPNTTYTVSLPTMTGSAFEVLSKTTTTVTLKQTASTIAVTAGVRLLLLAYA